MDMQTLLEIGVLNALMAAGLALLVACIGRLCRRPAVMHLLWMLVLLKLITPPAMWVPLAWPEALTRAATEPPTDAPELSRELRPTSATDSAPEPEDMLECCAEVVSSDEESPLPALEASLPPAMAQSIESRPATPVPGWAGEHWQHAALMTWIVGSGLWFVVGVWRIYCFNRLLRFGKPAPAWIQEEARELANQMGLPRCPALLVVPGKVSPLLWAAGGRARLILPGALLRRLQPDQLSTLLAHELAHARRRDHWVRWLELVATSLYWWHPVAWWARHGIQQVEEQCCDAWVVHLLPQAAKAYAKALLQTVDFLDSRPALPPVASGVGHVHLLKRRLTMIVREPLSPRIPWPIGIGALCLGLLILPLAPGRVQAKPEKDLTARVTLDDEGPAAGAAQDANAQDLEKRMQRLEERMDRLLRTLEGRRNTSVRTPPSQPEEAAKSQAREEEKKALQAAREAEKKARELVRDAQRKAEQARRDAERAVAEQKRRSLSAKTEESADTKKPDKPRETRVRIGVDGNLDPEQMKKIEKQIHEAIHQALDPERMKMLTEQIHKSIDESISPERMKQLEKQIQSAVSGINTQRIEAMARQIERAVDRSLNAEQQERSMRGTESRTTETPRAASARGRATTSTTTSQSQRDLERRLDKLEQKMNKLIESLESSRKSIQ